MASTLIDPLAALDQAMNGAGITATQLKQNLGAALRSLPKVGVSLVTKHHVVEAMLVSPDLLNALMAEVRESRAAKLQTLAKLYDARVEAMSSPANVAATEKLLGFKL